jgi:hypothetical protein
MQKAARLTSSRTARWARVACVVPLRMAPTVSALRPAALPRSFARYAQDLIFGTDQHTDTYNVLRQSQEGFHGFAKDDAYEALGTPGKRRVRGLAAQSLFAALLLAAAGVRKIRRFLANATLDENGDRYVKRVTRKGEHATTHYPPGIPGSRGDPARDHPERELPEEPEAA